MRQVATPPWGLVCLASAAVEASAAVGASAVLAVVIPAAAKIDCSAGPREHCCLACPAAG